MSLLAEILSSRVRAEIFRLLFGPAGTKLHMRELERQSGCVIGTIQTELKKLLRLGLVLRERDGNRLYYQANTEHPIYPEIRNLVSKTTGLVELLRQRLADEPEIAIAFLFGSMARGDMTPASDVDLLVIGALGLRQLTALLSGLSGEVGREINPHVMAPEEFARRAKARDHFVTGLMEGAKVFVKGGRDDLAKLG